MVMNYGQECHNIVISRPRSKVFEEGHSTVETRKIMGFRILLLICFYFSFVLCNTSDSEHCYAETSDANSFMGTKTAYEFGRGNISRLSPEFNCRPVQIWALIRHGTRYPSSKEIDQFSNLHALRDEIIDNHERKKKGRLCQADLDNFRNWAFDSNGMTPKSLTAQGEKELRSLAKRLRAAFPELLQADPRNITQKDYLFRATDEQRTRASLESFMSELFGSKDAIKPIEAPKNDSLLYTYENCPMYEEGLESEEVIGETNKFTAGPEFRKLVNNVSERLGFDHIIDEDTILLMYEVCRYEKAWQIDRPSVWCAAFLKEDISVLEYREDMGCYYYCGPGRRINELLGCPSLKDIFQHFRNIDKERTNSDEPKGIFYFSHTVTLQATMAALGIGRDSPVPLAMNYDLQKNRTFKTSFIGPFAANIVIVFYECNDVSTPYRVTLHVSERPWLLDGCANYACDWKTIERRFGNTASQCNLSFCYQ